MDTCHTIVFDLLRCAISKEQFVPKRDICSDWSAIYDIIHKNKLHGIIYPVVKNFQERLALPDDVYKKWQLQVLQRSAYQQRANRETLALLSAAHAQGIDALTFKGLALAQLYPFAETRFSGDCDILVSDEHCKRMERLMTERSYSCNKELSKQNVHIWLLPNTLLVELHLRLWEDFDNEHTAILHRLRLDAEETRLLTQQDGGRFYTLGHWQHLVYQIYHIVKHLTYKGIDIVHFSDITLFVNKHIQNIDMPLFWQAMRELGYDVFCEFFFRTCVQYLGMSPDALCPALASTPLALGDILAEILQVGIVQHGSKQADDASVTVYRSYYRSGKKSRFALFTQLIFPKPSELNSRYKYAQRCVVLLPVAWVHRAFVRLFGKKETNGSLSEQISGSMDIATRRLELLKDLRLM